MSCTQLSEISNLLRSKDHLRSRRQQWKVELFVACGFLVDAILVTPDERPGGPIQGFRFFSGESVNIDGR